MKNNETSVVFQPIAGITMPRAASAKVAGAYPDTKKDQLSVEKPPDFSTKQYIGKIHSGYRILELKMKRRVAADLLTSILKAIITGPSDRLL